ncbi:uncharacterized protein GGS25DRAFT_509407 [Hypoxylon fragiforme]|uniref:uncharacterized protein n=1 Tax=Hypoxylon fragiforme TaxID=63214 RepID=UPI0020C6FF9A|nr:uncharacterized protein GGS25DRAFT_509407 [Hypoxylon fragiforme]KAI2602969.1 hypothetical protein GGS25DRAFT_509407 [Hypoxylon fragiforme]
MYLTGCILHQLHTCAGQVVTTSSTRDRKCDITVPSHQFKSSLFKSSLLIHACYHSHPLQTNSTTVQIIYHYRAGDTVGLYTDS